MRNLFTLLSFGEDDYVQNVIQRYFAIYIFNHINLQELKEACKWFEKVLVQNIHSDIRADLIDSIKSIPRWRLIQASLPHVMHAVTNVLYNRQVINTSIQEIHKLSFIHSEVVTSDECQYTSVFKKKLYIVQNSKYGACQEKKVYHQIKETLERRMCIYPIMLPNNLWSGTNTL